MENISSVIDKEQTENEEIINLGPVATGNDKIIIIKHQFYISDKDEYHDSGVPSSIKLDIRNISEYRIASAVFEIELYDEKGKVLDTLRHKEIDLKSHDGRSVSVNYMRFNHEYDLVKSYSIKLIKMTTADIERIQFRNQRVRTTEAGEEAEGIVKNISDVKTDAAVIVTYLDKYQETLGTRVVVLKDIEPNSIRPFRSIFKPQYGDRVYTIKFNIGDIAE
ncbi:MAG: hypothetical protein ACOWWR_10770 [Eubacteriales bacterium]